MNEAKSYEVKYVLRLCGIGNPDGAWVCEAEDVIDAVAQFWATLEGIMNGALKCLAEVIGVRRIY